MPDQIKQDINALVERPSAPRTLPPVEPVGGFEAQRGYAAYTGGGGGGGAGGGIASPLTEADAATRQYWDDSILLSADYLIGIEIKPLKQINMTDAAGAAVVMRYAVPEL